MTFATSRYAANAGTYVEVTVNGVTSRPPVSVRPANIGTLSTVLIWDGPLSGSVPVGSRISVRVRGLERDGAPADVAWETRGVSCAGD